MDFTALDEIGGEINTFTATSPAAFRRAIASLNRRGYSEVEILDATGCRVHDALFLESKPVRNIMFPTCY